MLMRGNILLAVLWGVKVCQGGAVMSSLVKSSAAKSEKSVSKPEGGAAVKEEEKGIPSPNPNPEKASRGFSVSDACGHGREPKLWG